MPTFHELCVAADEAEESLLQAMEAGMGVAAANKYAQEACNAMCAHPEYRAQMRAQEEAGQEMMCNAEAEHVDDLYREHLAGF